MVINSGDYYEGVRRPTSRDNRFTGDERTRKRGMRNQVGALINTRMGEGNFNSRPLGQVMAPQPMPLNEEEYNRRVQENRSWLQDEKTRAALFAFGVSLMQAPGDNWIQGLGNAVGAAAGAAGEMEAQEAAAMQAQHEAMMEERKLQLQERGQRFEEEKFDINRTDAMRSNAAEQIFKAKEYGLDERKQSFEERKWEQEREDALAAGRVQKYAKVVGATDPLNQQFNLGLTGTQTARVEGEQDIQTGKYLSANVQSEFGSQSSAAELNTGLRVVKDPVTGEIRHEEVKGGKAERERLAAEAKEEGKEKDKLTDNQLTLSYIDDALNMLKSTDNPDLYITGLGGAATGWVPNTPAYDYREKLETIKANVAFEELQEMRNNSPTGGTLGNVSDTDIRLLTVTKGSLDPWQSGQQQAEHLQRIKWIYEDIIHGGQITAIGRRVEKGLITPEQGMIEAQKLVDLQLGKKTEPTKIETESFQAPATPPPYVSEQDKELWGRYSDEEKKAVLQWYKENGGKE